MRINPYKMKNSCQKTKPSKVIMMLFAKSRIFLLPRRPSMLACSRGTAVLSLFALALSTVAERPGLLSPGLTNKQLALQHFFHNYTMGPSDHWASLWQMNGLGITQTSQRSLRYSLAFTGYASGALAFVHTPAYPDLAAGVLRSVFDRFLQPEVFDYWFEQGK